MNEESRNCFSKIRFRGVLDAAVCTSQLCGLHITVVKCGATGHSCVIQSGVFLLKAISRRVLRRELVKVWKLGTEIARRIGWRPNGYWRLSSLPTYCSALL